MLEYIQNLPQIIIELFRENPWGQWIWMIAFAISIVNFWFMKDRNFIWGTLFASLAWGLNFFFLWAFAAAYINFFDVFKNWAALMWEKSKKALQFFLIVYVIVWIWNFLWIHFTQYSQIISFFPILSSGALWDLDYISLIPTLTALLSTYLVFKTSWVTMKAWFLVVVVVWLIYNIYFHNIWWILTDVSLWFMWIYWIWRDLKAEKKN